MTFSYCLLFKYPQLDYLASSCPWLCLIACRDYTWEMICIHCLLLGMGLLSSGEGLLLHFLGSIGEYTLGPLLSKVNAWEFQYSQMMEKPSWRPY